MGVSRLSAGESPNYVDQESPEKKSWGVTDDGGKEIITKLRKQKHANDRTKSFDGYLARRS